MHTHEYTAIYCSACGHKIVVPLYCKDRFCPICSPRRTYAIRRRLQRLLSSVRESRGQSLKMVTLTIPNSPDARESARILIRSYRRLRQRAWYKRRVTGGVHVIEVTGSPGDWHVHLHAIVLSYFLPYEQLLSIWRNVSPGRGVYVQRIPRNSALSYLTKYVSKGSLPDGSTRELSDQLKGLRMFQCTGRFVAWLPPAVKHPYPCPRCGDTHWLPEVVVALLRRRARSPSSFEFEPD
jgi:hypothetical protein